LIHRDYSAGTPIQIRVYANKLSTWNPGRRRRRDRDGWVHDERFDAAKRPALSEQVAIFAQLRGVR